MLTPPRAFLSTTPTSAARHQPANDWLTSLRPPLHLNPRVLTRSSHRLRGVITSQHLYSASAQKKNSHPPHTHTMVMTPQPLSRWPARDPKRSPEDHPENHCVHLYDYLATVRGAAHGLRVVCGLVTTKKGLGPLPSLRTSRSQQVSQLTFLAISPTIPHPIPCTALLDRLQAAETSFSAAAHPRP